MADSIYAYARGEGLRDRLYTMLNQQVDNRTAEEIISSVIEKAGLRIV